MERSCERCGAAFEAKRSSAKYCSSSCRAESSKQRSRNSEMAEVTTIGIDPEPEQADGLRAVVRRRLVEVDRLDTIVGQQALVMAGRLDNSFRDTGSAVAAMSKELDRLMGLITAEVPVESDALDDLVADVVHMRSRRRA